MIIYLSFGIFIWLCAWIGHLWAKWPKPFKHNTIFGVLRGALLGVLFWPFMIVAMAYINQKELQK